MPVVTIAEGVRGTGVTDAAGVRVRPLVAGDLDEADRICRVAFGTFVGAPQPESFFGDADMVRTRWQAAPGAALAAEVGAAWPDRISPRTGGASASSAR
jgi:hypothetical protein